MPRSLYRLMYWLMPRLAVLALACLALDWLIRLIL
jgi:hypothetical protein